jgi:hypothetical protein
MGATTSAGVGSGIGTVPLVLGGSGISDGAALVMTVGRAKNE